MENAFHFDSSLKHKLMQAGKHQQREGEGGVGGGNRPLIDDLQKVIEAKRIELN